MNILAVTIIVLIFVFIPFELFFIHDTGIIKPDVKYNMLIKNEKISEIPAAYLEPHNAQTTLLPILVTQHIQSDFPISSINLHDIHFLNMEYESKNGGIANFPIPGNFDTGVKSEYGQPVIPIFGSACPLVGYSLNVSCSLDDQREITYGRCPTAIVRTFSDVLSTQVRGVFPDQDGTYKLEFMSYFETNVGLPSGANLLHHEILTCDVIEENEYFTEVYFHELDFELQD